MKDGGRKPSFPYMGIRGIRSKRGLVSYVVGVLVLVSSVVASVILFTIASPTSLRYEGTSGSAGPDELRLVYKTLYLGCGHLVEETHSFPAGAGLEIVERLKSGETGWRLESRAEGAFIFASEDPGMCPEDSRFRHLRIQGDGRLAVYYGKPGGNGPLKELTSVSVSHLLDEDIKRITEGIVLEGDEEVNKYLEGLRD